MSLCFKTMIKLVFLSQNPVYSTYTPNITVPVIDDGGYNQGSNQGYNQGSNQGYNQGSNQGYVGGGSQYTTPQNTYSQFRGYSAPSSGQTYGNTNNLTAYNIYRQSYGYNDGRQSQSRPNYRPQQQVIRPPPPQIRPNYGQPSQNNYRQPTSQYSNPYQSSVQGYSEHGYSQPSYGSSNYGGDSYGSYGGGQSYASPPQSPVYAPSYGVSAPVYDQGYDQGYHQTDHGYGHEDHSYGNSYNPNSSPYSPAPIDYSKYVSPMPYSELSEYMRFVPIFVNFNEFFNLFTVRRSITSTQGCCTKLIMCPPLPPTRGHTLINTTLQTIRAINTNKTFKWLWQWLS